MRYHKLKAGECPGTYVVTEPVTEQDLLRIASDWLKAPPSPVPQSQLSGCKPCCRTGSMKCLAHCSSTHSIAC